MALMKPGTGAPAQSTVNPILGQPTQADDVPFEVDTPPLFDEETGEILDLATPQPNPIRTVPATPAPVGMPALLSAQTLADMQAKGLTFDFTSFPYITLPNGQGFVDSEKNSLGQSFECRLMDSRQRWLYKGSLYEKGREVNELVYSYDQETAATNGQPVSDYTTKWQREGRTVSVKRYLEVFVVMEAPGEAWDGEYRCLSVPETSIGRLSPHWAKCVAKGGGNPGGVVTRVLVGKEVTKTAVPFFPWAFEIAS